MVSSIGSLEIGCAGREWQPNHLLTSAASGVCVELGRLFILSDQALLFYFGFSVVFSFSLTGCISSKKTSRQGDLGGTLRYQIEMPRTRTMECVQCFIYCYC